MIRSMIFALTSTAFAAVFLLPFSAHSEVRDQDLLAAICQNGKIGLDECAAARDYPNGESCNMKLSGDRAEGRFLGGETNYLLAVYSSDCEAHASSFGGSLLFEKKGDAVSFKGYHPGLVMRDCLNFPAGGVGDQLICSVSWMGQGYQFQGVVEVKFNKDQAGTISTDFRNLLEANDSIGARGANIIDCNQQLIYFGFDNLKAGPDARTIALDLIYADKAMIDEICAKPDRNAEAGDIPLSEGEGYVAEGEAKTGHFIFKLGKDSLTPVH